MALLDHFHPPLKGRRHWHSFHHTWAAVLAADLNKQLPERHGNLHAELLARLEAVTELKTDLYVAAYRVVEREGQISLDFWEEALQIGGALPTVPLWLRGGLCLPVDLETTYQQACLSIRIPLNGATAID